MKRHTGYGKEVDSLVKQLKQRYNPEKIILYGSFGRGDYDEYSDIDMLIIKKTGKRFLDRIGEVLNLCDYTRAFEPLVYTPEEISVMRKSNSFIRNVLKEGKVVYESKPFNRG